MDSRVAWLIGARGGQHSAAPKSRQMPDAPLSPILPHFCRHLQTAVRGGPPPLRHWQWKNEVRHFSLLWTIVHQQYAKF